MRMLLGSCALVSALLLTGCASAEDVAQGGSGGDETTPTTEPTEPTEPTDVTTTPPSPTMSTPTTTSPTPTTPTTTTPPPEPDVAPRPIVGNCYATTKRAFRQQRDGSEPLSCSKIHTAETFAVFQAGSAPSSSEIDTVWRKCHGRFPGYVGDAATISKLDLALVLPRDDQVSAGQKWIRCDVILKSSYNSRVGFAVRGSLQSALSGGVPRAYRGCVKRWPKVFQAVKFTSCNQSHQAELIPDALFLGPPEATYPGASEAEDRSKNFCEGVFQNFVPETSFYYYYYPTAASWKSGSHHTTCWALDTQGDGLPPL